MPIIHTRLQALIVLPPHGLAMIIARIKGAREITGIYLNNKKVL